VVAHKLALLLLLTQELLELVAVAAQHRITGLLELLVPAEAGV
jgi:hypothetical protein